MKKIGITGSLASGKTTVSKILSFKKGPLFDADHVVKKLYLLKSFKKLISKRLNINNSLNIKKEITALILKDKSKIKKLEKIIHPFVRKEMYNFIKKNKKRNILFFEIPLLIESKLMKNFDVIFFVRAKKNIRMKRFIMKGGNKKLFQILNSKQLVDKKKVKYCDYVITNENNFNVLKKKLSSILKRHERSIFGH
tara:strand:+ start:414 stop:998 length:585 start_codon:yes stop_codon:yes gene_type:complete